MKLSRGKRFVKGMMPIIVMLSIGGIGAGMAYAQQGKTQQGKVEGVNSAPVAADKTDAKGRGCCEVQHSNTSPDYYWETKKACDSEPGSSVFHSQWTSDRCPA